MKASGMLILCLLLSGCLATPVQRNFPTAPADLMKPVPQLQSLPPDTKDLDQMLLNINHNYSLYHELGIRVEAWQQWYREQKQIFDAVK